MKTHKMQKNIKPPKNIQIPLQILTKKRKNYQNKKKQKTTKNTDTPQTTLMLH